MTGYLDDITVDSTDTAAQEALLRPLTQSIRSLIDAAIRTQVDREVIVETTAALEQLAARLRSRQFDGSYGHQPGIAGAQRSWASPVIGVRNPIAPPLAMAHDPDGRVWADFEIGVGYEGPPGLVHGGVSALILDHVLGESVHTSGHWGMTGTLSMRYRRPTPLHRPLRAEGKIARIEGRKVFAEGSISDEGGVTVEASGIFILRPDRTAG